MKLLLLALFVVTSCSSHHHPKPRPVFDTEKICSPEANAYLKKFRIADKTASAAPVHHSVELIRKEILILQEPMAECYRQEIARTNVTDTFLLCYVVGTDKNGKTEFSDFYTSSVKLSAEFYSCVNKMKQPDLSQFKSTRISQPFYLYPKE